MKRTNFRRKPDEIAAFRFEEMWRKIGKIALKVLNGGNLKSLTPGFSALGLGKLG